MKTLFSLCIVGFIFSTFSFAEGLKTDISTMQQARTAQIDSQINDQVK